MAEFTAKNGALFINGVKVIKGWESFSGWYWFATEDAGRQDSVIGGKVCENDQIWFGLVQGFEEEWGEFSESELRLMFPKVWCIKRTDLASAGKRNFYG
jgi:hypothetical protein